LRALPVALPLLFATTAGTDVTADIRNPFATLLAPPEEATSAGHEQHLPETLGAFLFDFHNGLHSALVLFASYLHPGMYTIDRS
jgi:hypothetical protein